MVGYIRTLTILCACHNQSVGCAVKFVFVTEESRLVTIEVELVSDSSL
jgi:hypothetical protein